MADLQKALSIPCAYAAGEFTDTGELVAYAGNISLKTAKMAAMMCAANKMMGKMQASGWTDYTGKDGFEPSDTTQPAVGYHTPGAATGQFASSRNRQTAR